MNAVGIKLLVTTLVIVSLAGCASLRQEQARGHREVARFTATRKVYAATIGAPLTIQSAPYLLGRTLKVVKPSPAWLRHQITYISTSAQSIYQVAAKLGAITGVAVSVRDITPPSSSSTTSGSSGAIAKPRMLLNTGGVGGMTFRLRGNNNTNGGTGMNSFTARHPGRVEASIRWSHGSFRGLLNYIVTRYGVYWKANDTGIVLFKYTTHTYPVGVAVINNQIATSIDVAGGGSTSSGAGSSGSPSGGGTPSGGASSGSGSLSVSGKSSLSPYTDVISGVRTIVDAAGPGQGVVVASPALGTVTVTAPPPVQREVGRYLAQQNQVAARNIVVGVKIYSLILSNNANLGGSIEVAFENIRKNLKATLGGVALKAVLATAGGAPATSGLGSLSLIVPSTAIGSGAHWSGSQVVIDALKSVGTVNLVTSGTVVTSNGQPGPIQVARQIAYLAQASTTTTTNAGATTALTPATLTVGFTANFLPRILSHNRIMLSYQMQLSSLLSLKTISSGKSTIQTPQTSTQSASQSVVLRNGQTLVMAGFGQSNHNTGTGMGMLSGYRNNSRSRTWLIILLHVAEVAL